jgi:hypothetical protein
MSLYDVSEHDSCWRMSQWMQASDVIKQLYSMTRDNSINLRSYLTMTNVKEFNKCIRIKKGGIEGEGRIGKWLLSYICLTEFCVSCKVSIPHAKLGL